MALNTLKGLYGTRSPLYVTWSGTSVTSIQSVSLEIYIWTGAVGSRPASPHITINRTTGFGSNTTHTTDISSLIADQLNTNIAKLFNDNILSEQNGRIAWVQIDYSVSYNSGSTDSDSSDIFQVIEGYSYFDEGANYEFSTGILSPTSDQNRTKRASIHYVNNKEFSQAVVDYVRTLNEAQKAETKLPIVPNYIASCFLKIAEGLSHKSNFIRYTYREEMVMDAVENCLRAIDNYNIEAATRTGNPNAFAYFTQISWYAFLRRIAKEKKQQDVKIKFLSQSGLEEYIATNQDDSQSVQVVRAFVDQLKDRIDKVKEKDDEVKVFAQEEKKRKKRNVTVDSDLGDFIK